MKDIATLARQFLHTKPEDLTDRERRVLERFVERRRISRNVGKMLDKDMSFGDRLADGDAGIFGGVVKIDVQVALGAQIYVDQAVARELLQHVIEKADAGFHIVNPGAVEIDLRHDAGFLGQALDAPAPERHVVPTADGWKVALTRYQGGAKGPVLLAPGFSVKALSFATDTVARNLVEELCAADYDVWLFDYRASADSGNPLDPPEPFTIDDIAQHDWPAAVDFVRARTGAESVQAMAHCVGSMSLLMALAAGHVSGIRSVVSSQLTLHPVTDWMNYLKADIGTAKLMGQVAQLGGHIGFAPTGTELDYEIDAVAYNLPVPEGQECKNPACRRVFGIFGPSYDHAQLGHATHVAIASMFSDISLKPFDQLSAIMHEGKVVDAAGKDVYLGTENVHRMALPITFLSGANNQIFYPEGAQRTRAWLAAYNDPALYEQIVIPDYAHMDLFIGRDAARDVAPIIVGELDRFN